MQFLSIIFAELTKNNEKNRIRWANLIKNSVLKIKQICSLKSLDGFLLQLLSIWEFKNNNLKLFYIDRIASLRKR